MDSPLDEFERLIFVYHEDPEDESLDIAWAVCNGCGTGTPIPGTALGLGDHVTVPVMVAWGRAHVCDPNASPDFFFMSEYGDLEAYYGLDLSLL